MLVNTTQEFPHSFSYILSKVPFSAPPKVIIYDFLTLLEFNLYQPNKVDTKNIFVDYYFIKVDKFVVFFDFIFLKVDKLPFFFVIFFFRSRHAYVVISLSASFLRFCRNFGTSESCLEEKVSLTSNSPLLYLLR